MSRSWTVGIVAVLAVVAGTLTGAPALAQSKSNAASDVGVTASTIKVAVVADVDNTIVPGVLQGIVDGVQGWGKYVNANGGIGGRKVQVDFIDSHLNPNDARNAIIKACSEDFALVGTGALLLQPLADTRAASTPPGAATGIPDIGALVTSQAEGCAPTCVRDRARRRWTAPPSTSHPQTYRANNGDSKYLLKQNKNLHGSFVLASDSPSVRARRRCSTRARRTPASRRTSDVERHRNRTAEQYTPIIQAMKNDSSNYGSSLQAVTGVVLGAAGGAAPGPHRPEDRLGVHARLLLRQGSQEGRRRGER